jgi:catechol-2,3-dioxygenase
MAFWELHDDSLPSDFATSLSGAVGLPPWTNHLAFDPGSMEELEAAKKRWLEHGYGVMEIDHDWCYSIYTRDPNGTLVEWCVTTAEFSEADAAKARKAVHSDDVEHSDAEPKVTMHSAEIRPLHKRLAEAQQG